MDQEKKKIRKRIAMGSEVPEKDKMVMYYWLYDEDAESCEIMIHSSKVTEVNPQTDRVYVVHTLNSIYIYYKMDEYEYDDFDANIGLVMKVPEAKKRLRIDLVSGTNDCFKVKRLVKVEDVKEIAEDCYKISDGKEEFYVYVLKK